MTVADLPEVCREAVGRLRQKGDADLLFQSVCFVDFGSSSDIRTRIGLVERRVSLRYPHSGKCSQVVGDTGWGYVKH